MLRTRRTSEYPKACTKKSTAGTGLVDRPRICTGVILRPGGCASTVRSGPAPSPVRPSPPLTGARPVEILRSPDVRVLLSRRAETMPSFVRNADGDEVQFVHAGRGRFETDYGVLAYEPGDYVVIPKGTTYRILIESSPVLFLIVETPEPVELPERGLLGHHAQFDRGVLTAPEPAPASEGEGREWEVHIKRNGEYPRVVYPFHPMDVVGWKGDLWVAKLNVRDFRPVMSPRYHLPPSVHVTFQA